tara:strand:+ start:416 stop:598 length:183 start_codon:yes stop_codon:yes gene_type:complete
MVEKEREKIKCLRCDQGISYKKYFCEKCFKETFDLPFRFIKQEGLLEKYENYVNELLKHR